MLLAALSWGSLSAQTSLEQAFANYIGLKNALVDGNVAQAATRASAMHETLQNMEPKGQKEQIETITDGLKVISSQKQIEQQRAELGKLSDALWGLIEDSSEFGKPAYYNYCPMKKTHWISESAAIRNPFYGKQMLTCGKVEKEIND